MKDGIKPSGVGCAQWAKERRLWQHSDRTIHCMPSHGDGMEEEGVGTRVI